MNNVALNTETALVHNSRQRNTKCDEVLVNWTIFSVKKAIEYFMK